MEVSRKGHIKAAAIAIAVILFISIACVLFYHHSYTSYIDTKIKQRVAVNEAKYERLRDGIKLHISDQESINQELVIVQAMMLLNDKMKTSLIEDRLENIENRLDVLERRHLEIIRAIAILQKDHWTEELRAESSGFTFYPKKPIPPTLLIPEEAPKIIFEELEKELENW